MAAADGWVRACATGEVADGEAVRLSTDPPIALFRVEGRFYATADTCSHAESSLADGYIEGDEVECAAHFAKFCIRTGAALSLPATEPVATYEVKVDGDEVFVLAVEP